MADDAEPADAPAILDRASRCLLVARGRPGPSVSPMAHWLDGEAVWMTAAADAPQVAALRDDPACLVAVAPDEDAPGMVARGRARVLSPAEPARFALHAPAILGAMSGLAARHVSTMADYALHAARSPRRWAPRHRVVVRLVLDSLEVLDSPGGATRVTPALPTVLPADVRRRLGGKRVVTVLWDQPPLRAVTATWGAGLTLGFPDERGAAARPGPGARVAVAADRDAARPSEVVGAVLHGALDDAGALVADRAVWWRGFDVRRGDIPASSDVVQIPD